MTLDGVPVDNGGVTGLERRRHAEAAFDCVQVLGILDIHREAVGPQVVDPVLAASAGR